MIQDITIEKATTITNGQTQAIRNIGNYKFALFWDTIILLFNALRTLLWNENKCKEKKFHFQLVSKMSILNGHANLTAGNVHEQSCEFACACASALCIYLYFFKKKHLHCAVKILEFITFPYTNRIV